MTDPESMVQGPAQPLLELLDSLYRAASDRHLAQVRELLFAAGAGRLPRDVREEAMALARSPAGSMRAPLALLRFRYVLEQLALEGGAENLETDPSQLELELAEG